MRPEQIEIGKLYCNGGKHTSRRRVISIGESRHWDSRKVVRYLQVAGPYRGEELTYPLDAFAKWAWAEVSP